MSDKDAKRYQYLKQWLEAGQLHLPGNILHRGNIDDWDSLIDDHLDRLTHQGKFQNGQKVLVSSLHPDQPAWLRKSGALTAIVLDSWLCSRSSKQVYKVKYTHNGYIDECPEHDLLTKNAFINDPLPSWVSDAGYTGSRISIELAEQPEIKALVELLVEIIKREHSARGDASVHVKGFSPYFHLAASMRKRLVFSFKHEVISKAALIAKLENLFEGAGC